MSISSEVTRLTTIRNAIRSKLISLGLLNDLSADLDDCATAIDGIRAMTTQEVATAVEAGWAS